MLGLTIREKAPALLGSRQFIWRARVRLECFHVRAVSEAASFLCCHRTRSEEITGRSDLTNRPRLLGACLCCGYAIKKMSIPFACPRH